MPAPKTVRQQLIEAVQTRFRSITEGEDYNFTLAAKVSIWRTTPFAVEELPDVDIRDTREESKAVLVGVHEHRLTVEGYAECASGGETAEQARRLWGDLYKAIGQTGEDNIPGRKWGGLARETEPGTCELQSVKDKNLIAGIKFSIVIIYRTPAWDPYTAAN